MNRILAVLVVGFACVQPLVGEEVPPQEEEEEEGLIADRERDLDDFNLYERNKMDLERKAERLMRHRCRRCYPCPRCER